MPSAMIHLLTAKHVQLWDDPYFMLGNIAPDYCGEREAKDALHLRKEANRVGAILKLRSELDLQNPFEAGWLLHLYTDMCWDVNVIPVFQSTFPEETDWFPIYRHEVHLAGYALYHSEAWAREALEAIERIDLSKIQTSLRIDMEKIASFRALLCEKHRNSEADAHSEAFPPDFTAFFAEITAREAQRELAL